MDDDKLMLPLFCLNLNQYVSFLEPDANAAKVEYLQLSSGLSCP